MRGEVRAEPGRIGARVDSTQPLEYPHCSARVEPGRAHQTSTQLIRLELLLTRVGLLEPLQADLAHPGREGPGGGGRQGRGRDDLLAQQAVYRMAPDHVRHLVRDYERELVTVAPGQLHQRRGDEEKPAGQGKGGRLVAPERTHLELVDRILEQELGGLGIATWTRPKGGYFVSLDVLPGAAARVVALAREVGLKLTPAGATFPYGRDPGDANIRIAPTFTVGDDLTTAMQVLAQCVKLGCVQQLRGAA